MSSGLAHLVITDSKETHVSLAKPTKNIAVVLTYVVGIIVILGIFWLVAIAAR